MTGFEPAASCSQSRRATELRYIPVSILHDPLAFSCARPGGRIPQLVNTVNTIPFPTINLTIKHY